MNRQILFRGKRVDNGEWIEGYLCNDYITGDLFIQHKISETKHPKWVANVIIPETVGQFTGLLDKNGSKIWEGDIIESGERKGLIQFGYSQFGINWDYEKNIDPLWNDGCMYGAWSQKDNLRRLSDGFNNEFVVLCSIHDKEGQE